jgi:hypothetical protein
MIGVQVPFPQSVGSRKHRENNAARRRAKTVSVAEIKHRGPPVALSAPPTVALEA